MRIKVLVIEPNKAPYEKEIEDGLASLQNEVGGMIQAIYPFEEEVAIICNDEGKLEGLRCISTLLGCYFLFTRRPSIEPHQNQPARPRSAH